MENKTKIRIILASVTVFFLILIGYLMHVDYGTKWTVEKLMIGPFAFYGAFTFTSYDALFATLLLFGIFVLPFVINELGILDVHTNETPDSYMSKERTIKDIERSFQKSRIGSIKNHLLPIGVISAIIASCLITLPSLFLKDSKPIERVFKTGELAGRKYLYIAEYYGFIRGQLLLIGILLLVAGCILFIRHRRRNLNSMEKEELSN